MISLGPSYGIDIQLNRTSTWIFGMGFHHCSCVVVAPNSHLRIVNMVIISTTRFAIMNTTYLSMEIALLNLSSAFSFNTENVMSFFILHKIGLAYWNQTLFSLVNIYPQHPSSTVFNHKTSLQLRSPLETGRNLLVA